MKKNSLFFDFLNVEFIRRKNLNPRYSLRAYAKNLNVSSSLLSRLLKGKIPLSVKMLQRFSAPLKLNSEQILIFVNDLNAYNKQNKADLHEGRITTLSMEDLQIKISKIEVNANCPASLTVASFEIDSSLIPEIELRIKRFIKSQANFIEKKSKIKDQTYELTTVLYPAKELS